MADLTKNVLAFVRLLDTEYGFELGHADARTALEAIDAGGVANKTRVRYALRMVCCSKQEHIATFDRAFDRFFGNEELGQPQPRMPQTRPGEEDRSIAAGRREIHEDDSSPAQTWQAMRARFSPIAATGDAAALVPDAGLAETLADASRLISALHLGRSRKWKPHVRGSRLDIRRTLRSSLQSGGDPLYLRTFGHPLRNPRIVLLIDASRSMAEHAGPLLQFGYALAQRSRRASVFVFSTELTEITRTLRRLPHTPRRALGLTGEVWGGGTRLGSSLLEFSKRYAGRVDADTLIVIASDGLDASGANDLREALRRLYRASAGIIWLNPHAGTPGFMPQARSMQTALPYVCALLDSQDLRAVAAAARTLRR